MAQSGFTPIQLYYSTSAGNTPLAADLTNGELAINTNDGILYYKDSSGVVQVLASGSSVSILSVLVATTANITLSGTQTIDGVSVTASQRVLVKDQTLSQNNGVYVASAGAWARSIDTNSSSEIAGRIISVRSGTLNGGEQFATTFKSTDTLGTTAMLWFQVALQNTAVTFTDLTVTGNTAIGDADTDTITQAASYVTGTQLKSAKVATNTLALAAYDVDGTAYTNLVTLTASNTPTLALTSTGVGTINNMSIGATTASTGAFTTLTSNSSTTFTAGTASTTTGTGTLVITGGLGVSGRINAANFDGIIGANTAAAGTFTTLTSTGNTTLGDAAADSVTVNGTIASNLIFTDNTYDIGASGATRPRNLFLAGNATVGGNIVLTGSLDLTNLEVTNIKAKDGTASATIADSTGVMTIGSSVLTTTDINGGAIDGTTVGAASASTGAFTTLSATGVTTVQAGTAALPAITTTGDTNTGIFFPAADTIAFTEGGVESMRIDSSGNVGIGTSSPTQPLVVSKNSNASTWVNVVNTTSGTGALAGVLMTSDASIQASIELTSSTHSANANMLRVRQIGAYPIGFFTNNTERMRIDSSGNVGIGTTAPSSYGKLAVLGGNVYTDQNFTTAANGGYWASGVSTYNVGWYESSGAMLFRSGTGGTERMRIDSSGNLLVGKTVTTFSTAGSVRFNSGQIQATVNGDDIIAVNRLTNDGSLVRFFQDGVEEGNISVSGSTVSYNGGHLSRWAQTTAPKDDTLVKGTVLSNLDEMNVYTDADGNPVDNEQLNKVKVSDVEGDANVAGVFVNWDHDEAHDVEEINMAMTGDMIIRIAQGTTVARGDLLMSAGDGTAKPQGDDIVRSKTVAKVTSTHVTCTYADGSFCVPCVLMAC